ncbi:MAG: CopD family protein [Pseudomonadaceae bacterium]|jgi:putative copper export protein|nr:CopD family protein [Pseudomonadaceae bacterium]
MYPYLLLIHILAATVWTGGHLVLALGLLPGILRRRAVNELIAFEAAYEKWGMSALIIQVISGLWLAYIRQPDITSWFTAEHFPSRLIQLKLGLLALTLLVAVDARLRVIPNLSVQTLPAMALRIRLVTLLGVGFVVTGTTFRTGPWW